MHKKLLYILLIILLFTGCSKKDITTKTCTLEKEGLPKQIFVISATNDVVDKMQVTAIYTNKLLAVEDFTKLSKSEKENMVNGIMKTLGIDKLHYDGIDIDFQFDDKMTITIDTEFKYAKAKILDQLGIDITKYKAKKMTDVTTYLDSNGAICE